MPRLANAGHAVDRWYEQNDGNGSSTFDVCASCADDLTDAQLHSKLTPYNGDPQGEGWEEIDHPPYGETEYECEVCGATLTNEDN